MGLILDGRCQARRSITVCSLGQPAEQFRLMRYHGEPAWSHWRKANPEAEPDLSRASLWGADLHAANLSGADLHRANLGKVNLRRSDARGADLVGADLTEADLVEANLTRANLTGSILKWADLSRTELVGTNFTRVRLTASNFAGAGTWDTIFVDCDLSAARGLETIQHLGPSSIAIDTIYRSNGQIPESFLRGCGVPDAFINLMKSLIANPIDFYSCFISYSFADQDFAERLHSDLQNKRVRCWFAHTTYKVARNSTSRSTRPFACTTSCY